MVGEISASGEVNDIDLDYMDNVQQNVNTMGFEFDMNTVFENCDKFILPEYFSLDANDEWQAIAEDEVPNATDLLDALVPITPRSEITYLTPLDPECQWQDPNGPWNSPGPTAGPFQADLGDGSTVTYHWYRFVDQPAIIQADLPENVRDALQERIELIHSNWNHMDEYIAPPLVGEIATVDPAAVIQPPAGLEIGYVPIVTRQEKTQSKVRVFVLAGQSNMVGYGTISDPEDDPGSLIDVIENDVDGIWSDIGDVGNWTTLDDAYVYFANDGDTIRSNVTVGQGGNSNLIGAELMFAHQLDACFDLFFKIFIG